MSAPLLVYVQMFAYHDFIQQVQLANIIDPELVGWNYSGDGERAFPTSLWGIAGRRDHDRQTSDCGVH